MSDNLVAGGVWSPTQDQVLNTDDFWQEAIAKYQKPSGTPPWHTPNIRHDSCTASEHTNPAHNFDNRHSLHQHPAPGSTGWLDVNTPPLSSTASSQEYHEAGNSPLLYHTQESALIATSNNQSSEQFGLIPPIFVFSPQGFNLYDGDWTAAPSHGSFEPVSLDHQTKSAGEWQASSLHDFDEHATQLSPLSLIENPESSQHIDLQADCPPGTIQRYGCSTPQEDPNDFIPATNNDVYHDKLRDGFVMSNTQSVANAHAPSTHDQPPPAKRPRISIPSPSKSNKSKQTKIIKRGSVPQYIFATDNHVSRAAYGPERLEQVNERRKTGACVCCRWTKKPCKMPEGSSETLGEAPCRGCEQRMRGRKGTHLCFIFNIDHIQMFRPHSPLHTRSATAPIEYIPGTTKTIDIRLTGALQSDPIRVKCLEFKPHDDDVLVKMFGSSEQIPMSPYAIVNLDDYKEALAPMLPALTETFLEDLRRTGCSNAVSKTFRAAVRYRDEHPDTLVAEALRIWVYCKLCGTEKVLVGAQQLGVTPVREEGVDLEGMVPVPPKIDHQTDTAMIDLMKDDALVLMDRLKRLIDQKSREDWYQIFLTVFIILNNIEFLLRRQEFFLEDMKMNRTKLHAIVQPSNQRDRDMIVVERCIEGSESLNSTFRTTADQILQIYQLYASTKRAPFAVKRSSKDLKEASLLPHEIAYVESMQKDRDDLINQHRDKHESKNHRHEMRWAAQLFQQLD